MPYTAQISRVSPACVLLLIDQSKSMAKPFPGSPGQTKAAAVADAVNRLIQNLVLRSAKADGPVTRDEWIKAGVLGGVFLVFGVLGPDVLGRDRDSSYPFTVKQMGPYHVASDAQARVGR